MKYLKKLPIILLLAFVTFLFWLNKREIKKEPFKKSAFQLEQEQQNAKILHKSKLNDSEYRKYLRQEIEKKKRDQERKNEEEDDDDEEEQEHKTNHSEKAKSKDAKEKKDKKVKTKKIKEFDGKIKEKTKRARIKKEQENNRIDKYIFKKKMKSKKRP